MQNYFYIANKPRGMSSAQCVNQFKKKTKCKKNWPYGHFRAISSWNFATCNK